MRGLQGRVALVTGAASGIGQAVALRLGEEGCHLAAIDRMVERRSGAIVNIASEAGRVGSEGEVVSSGAKAGVIGFSKGLAREVVAAGVRVNVVCPGPTDTPMMASNPGLADILVKY